MTPMFFQEEQQQQQNTDYSLIMDLPDPGSSPALGSAWKITEQNIDSLTIREALSAQ